MPATATSRVNEEFFKQLTAEQLVTRVVNGYPKPEWQKTRERNEAHVRAWQRTGGQPLRKPYAQIRRTARSSTNSPKWIGNRKPPVTVHAMPYHVESVPDQRRILIV